VKDYAKDNTSNDIKKAKVCLYHRLFNMINDHYDFLHAIFDYDYEPATVASNPTISNSTISNSITELVSASPALDSVSSENDNVAQLPSAKRTRTTTSSLEFLDPPSDNIVSDPNLEWYNSIVDFIDNLESNTSYNSLMKRYLSYIYSTMISDDSATGYTKDEIDSLCINIDLLVRLMCSSLFKTFKDTDFREFIQFLRSYCDALGISSMKRDINKYLVDDFQNNIRNNIQTFPSARNKFIKELTSIFVRLYEVFGMDDETLALMFKYHTKNNTISSNPTFGATTPPRGTKRSNPFSGGFGSGTTEPFGSGTTNTWEFK
jgi:hypothetical protein